MVARDGEIKIIGPDHAVKKAKSVFSTLIELSRRGEEIGEQNVDYALALSFEGKDEELLEIYRQVKAGEEELSALDAALRRSMPVIPLAYRRGIAALSPDFSANMVATEQDIFYNIGEW